MVKLYNIIVLLINDISHYRGQRINNLTVQWFDGSVVRWFSGQNVHWPESSVIQRFVGPNVHYFIYNISFSGIRVIC